MASPLYRKPTAPMIGAPVDDAIVPRKQTAFQRQQAAAAAPPAAIAAPVGVPAPTPTATTAGAPLPTLKQRVLSGVQQRTQANTQALGDTKMGAPSNTVARPVPAPGPAKTGQPKVFPGAATPAAPGSVEFGGSGIITTTADPKTGASPWGQLPTKPPADEMLSDFGPGNDLRSTQINPASSGRLVGAGQATDAARQDLVNYAEPEFQGVAAPSQFQTGADTSRARQLTSQGLESLVGAPSRQQLAADALQNFIQSTEPEYQRRQQEVGRRAAALGRLGSGMTADDVMRLGNSREQEIIQQSRELANQTAGQELSDRALRLDAARGVAGQFGGEDLDRAGFEQGLRGEARGERGDYLNYGQQQFANRRARLADLSGEESRQFGQESARRGELRTERDYQTGQADRAQRNRLDQRLLEEDIQQRAFERALRRAQLQGGFARDFADEGDLDQQAAADLLQQLAMRRALERQGG